MKTKRKALPRSCSCSHCRDQNNVKYSPLQNSFDIYLEDYFMKRKLYETARFFRVERSTTMDPDTLQQRDQLKSEAVGYLWMWWSTFWDIYLSKHHNKENHPPPNNYSLINQVPMVAPTQEYLATKFPFDGREKMVRAKVKKYLDDELIPNNFQKLLGEEGIPFKTPLKNSTPSLTEFQSSRVPLMIIDENDDEERSSIHNNDDNDKEKSSIHNDDKNRLSFNPEELLELLEHPLSP